MEIALRVHVVVRCILWEMGKCRPAGMRACSFLRVSRVRFRIRDKVRVSVRDRVGVRVNDGVSVSTFYFLSH